MQHSTTWEHVVSVAYTGRRNRASQLERRPYKCQRITVIIHAPPPHLGTRKSRYIGFYEDMFKLLNFYKASDIFYTLSKLDLILIGGGGAHNDLHPHSLR